MTSNFRKGVFSSHKPLCPHPEASQTPSIQKNPVGYLGIPTPLIFSKNAVLRSQISSEPPGTPKQSLVRPPGSLEVTNITENHYNQGRKEESLLPLEPIIISWEPNPKNVVQEIYENQEKTKKIPEKERKNPKFKATEGKFTRKRQQMEKNSNVIELPREVGLLIEEVQKKR
jgi:hypothetical protein